MFKKKTDKYLRTGYVIKNCWTLDKPMASLSTCHLGLLPLMKILLLLNLCRILSFVMCCGYIMFCIVLRNHISVVANLFGIRLFIDNVSLPYKILVW